MTSNKELVVCPHAVNPIGKSYGYVYNHYYERWPVNDPNSRPRAKSELAKKLVTIINNMFSDPIYNLYQFLNTKYEVTSKEHVNRTQYRKNACLKFIRRATDEQLLEIQNFIDKK
jgi:hypothetical protein